MFFPKRVPVSPYPTPTRLFSSRRLGYGPVVPTARRSGTDSDGGADSGATARSPERNNRADRRLDVRRRCGPGLPLDELQRRALEDDLPVCQESAPARPGRLSFPILRRPVGRASRFTSRRLVTAADSAGRCRRRRPAPACLTVARSWPAAIKSWWMLILSGRECSPSKPAGYRSARDG